MWPAIVACPMPLPPAGEVSQSVAGKLLQLCQALDAGDFVTATHLQARQHGRAWAGLQAVAPGRGRFNQLPCTGWLSGLAPALLRSTVVQQCKLEPGRHRWQAKRTGWLCLPASPASKLPSACRDAQMQVSLTTNDWDECAAWLTALKRLIKARHTMG